MVSAPGGTVTFLFTDIEGSTQRWENDASAMAPALARHDAILRRAIESNGGHVFKTIGDAFCAAFVRAESAVAAALDAQRELAATDFAAVGGLAVRMAIHTGTTIERESDYFGPTVNRVARLLAIAHGGQTLLSNVAGALVRDVMPGSALLEDLGEHALKDVRGTERVFQLSPAGPSRIFPPLRTPRATPSNLPFAISSFIGREEELARIRSELDRARAVTLVGTGGIGKTRCAIHVAANAADRFRQGVRLVELAAVPATEFVAPAVAAACDVFLSADEPPLDSLVRALQWRNVLIVLDNCEHVVAEAARVVERIVQRCPEVSVLATSREPLNLRGESVYRLPNLAVPPEGEPPQAAFAMHFDAVALFVNRAKAARPDFILGDENVATVCAICRRLDGIALAIELAAIRLRSLGLTELLERLQQRLRLLRGGARTDLPRQQTMRALVDWSYDLLSEAERAAFRRLAVFTNRFDLAAALEVCAQEDGAGEYDTLDLLESLVDKSLVAVDRDDRDGERPYRLLETLREYGVEKLTECGEYDATFARLARRCIVRARAAAESWERAGSAEWRRACENDVDDVRAALAWALEAGHDVELGVELAASSRRMWSALAPAEGRSWLLLAKDALDDRAAPSQAARVWLGVAQLHVALGQHAAALDAARRAAIGFTGPEHDVQRREADMYAGFSLALQGELEPAKRLLAPAVEAFEAAGFAHLAAVAATDLAVAHVYAEEFDDARRLFRQALARFRRCDDASGIEAVTVNFSELEFRAGDVETALRLTADAIAAHASGVPILMLSNMSAYLCALDRFDEARGYARESLTRAEEAGQDVDVAFSIQHLAAAAALEALANPAESGAKASAAAQLLGFVDGALEALSSVREFTERREYERAVSALRALLGHEAFESARNEGMASDVRRAIGAAKHL